VLATVGLSGSASVVAIGTARLLGPHDRGVIVVLLATTTIVLLVAARGTGVGLRTKMTGVEPLSVWQALSLASRVTMRGWVIMVPIGVPVLILAMGESSPQTLLVFIALAPAQLFNYLGREILHGVGLHATALLGEIGSNLLIGTASLLLWTSGTLSASTVGASFVMGAAMQAVAICLIAVKLSPRRGCDREYSVANLLRDSTGGFVSTIGQAIAQRADRLLVGLLLGTSAAGIYATAATLSELVALVALGASQTVYRRAGETRNAQESLKHVSPYVAASFVVGMLIAIFADPIVTFFLGEAYVEAIPVLRVLCVAGGFMSLHYVFIAALNGLALLRDAARATTAGAVVLIGGIVMFSPWHGVQAVAWSSVAAYWVSSSCAFVLLARYDRRGR
jgi:O-antigen/teichoic acid export membrane protein